ncbi:MAG: carboxypeptidase-like regulatory domain-containing protein [Candidatus Thermoplasmatota archaeon]|nr:carboxypeptidase-like regulatory domain-containing protein [Candidatus Thermoplasmatota archaeon]MBU1940165.1 carboxypeptidase-like regulatory domain-containing protein [Candidatus Thermoplasmatota archaeon]
MDKRYGNTIKILSICVILFLGSILPNISAATNQMGMDIYAQNEGTDYWALLIAVAEYADNPEEDRPLMLVEVDDFHDLLLESPLWTEDHIKVIKAEEATIFNIVKGFRWLDQMEDSDDISVVYITTHGFPIGADLPPVDEDDGTDEGLVSYWGFAYLKLFIWDDQINFLLNRLESQGVCMIVDSCFAGGFNDPPTWKTAAAAIQSKVYQTTQISAADWIQGFGEDVRAQGRVVLMASCEDEVSYSGAFAPYLIDGFRGYGDTNHDGIITAEEAFYYAEPRTSRQNPTIFDGYDGELPIISFPATTDERVSSDDFYKNVEKIKDKTPVQLMYSPENARVCGYVQDADTTLPLDDATVYVWGRDNQWEHYENETTTDITGYFSVNIPEGRFRVNVQAYGYLSDQQGPFEINENETQWVNFSLDQRPDETSVLCGFVTDSDTGDPIADANISLLWENAEHQYYLNDTASDHSGYYTFHVAAGTVELDFEADGYFHRDIENIIINDNKTVWRNISLPPRPLETATICGYITDEDTGIPLADARIEIWWVNFSSGFEYENEDNTNETGYYSIDIAAGEVYIDVRKQGYDYYNPYRQDAMTLST